MGTYIMHIRKKKKNKEVFLFGLLITPGQNLEYMSCLRMDPCYCSGVDIRF